jgi:plasmid stabilization system protein ParE
VSLVVAPAALADIERLHAFLVPKSPAAAGRAATALIDAVQSLAVLPERGRPSGTPNMRELIVPFGRSAYVLRYSHSAQADEVVVHRIWHGREERE